MTERELTVCELNAENLFIAMDYFRGQDLEAISEQEWRELAVAQLQRNQKPLAKVWGLAKAILDIDPDVLMMIEVGGEESLANLNRHFLGDRYVAYFVEGNSKRNIDLGFLVRKDLGFRAEARSNRETPIEINTFHGRHTARFSRDVAELRLYEGNRLKLILLLTHLKSKLSTEQDIQGKDARTAEAIALAGIYRNLRATYPDTPIILGGDFNASLSSLELELLSRTDLLDFHDALGTPYEERVSLFHFEFDGKPKPLVLDYLLVSPHLRERIIAAKSYTYRYKGLYDVPERMPTSINDRYQMPSDHYPVVLTVRL